MGEMGHCLIGDRPSPFFTGDLSGDLSGEMAACGDELCGEPLSCAFSLFWRRGVRCNEPYVPCGLCETGGANDCPPGVWWKNKSCTCSAGERCLRQMSRSSVERRAGGESGGELALVSPSLEAACAPLLCGGVSIVGVSAGVSALRATGEAFDASVPTSEWESEKPNGLSGLSGTHDESNLSRSRSCAVFVGWRLLGLSIVTRRNLFEKVGEGKLFFSRASRSRTLKLKKNGGRKLQLLGTCRNEEPTVDGTNQGKVTANQNTQGQGKAPRLKQKGCHSGLHDPQHSHPHQPSWHEEGGE
mgnify:CR=1 FL=1